MGVHAADNYFWKKKIGNFVKKIGNFLKKIFFGKFSKTFFSPKISREIEQNQKIVIAFKYMTLDQKLAGADAEKANFENALTYVLTFSKKKIISKFSFF